MAHIELDITSSQPCDDQRVPGSYFCRLDRWDSGLRHDFVQVGSESPMDLSVGDLTATILRVAEARPSAYKTKQAVPVYKLVGMSVVRACIHPTETPKGAAITQLVGERVASFAFVENVDTFYQAKYNYAVGSRVSAYGVGKLIVNGRQGEKTVAAQHLPVTPEEDSLYPVLHAIESLASRNMKHDVWVALRAVPDEERFLETLVSREELLDTMSPIS